MSLVLTPSALVVKGDTHQPAVGLVLAPGWGVAKLPFERLLAKVAPPFSGLVGRNRAVGYRFSVLPPAPGRQVNPQSVMFDADDHRLLFLERMVVRWRYIHQHRVLAAVQLRGDLVMRNIWDLGHEIEPYPLTGGRSVE